MNYGLTEGQQEFRRSLRAWLEGNLPDGWMDGKRTLPSDEGERVAFLRSWQRRMYDAGYIGLAWPVEHGGQGKSAAESLILFEELARVQAPRLINRPALHTLGPVLMQYATGPQRQRFLPGILTADVVWCQFFSEPEAGSDLASLRTRAAIDGDELVINGRKIWSSYAHFADWGFALVRTDPDAHKREGITFVLIDLKEAQGITVSPLRQITGEVDFNEVLFDDTRVPRANMVGAVNDGWRLARSTLNLERGASVFSELVRMRRTLEDLYWVAAARGVFDDYRADLGALSASLEAVRLTALRTIAGASTADYLTVSVGSMPSVIKVRRAECEQALYRLALEITGQEAVLASPDTDSPDHQLSRWPYGYLRARSSSIAGGTSEINRNILARDLVSRFRSARKEAR